MGRFQIILIHTQIRSIYIFFSFQDTTFPLSQKCQWPVHDCFVVRIFPFVKPFRTITQFFVHLAEVALPTNICWKEIPNKFWCYSIVCLLATTMSMAAQVWLLAHLSPHSNVLIRKCLPFEKNIKYTMFNEWYWYLAIKLS